MTSSDVDRKADFEEKLRVYPFDDKELPLLDDRNNYYSGTYTDCFWHQNSDQVLVFIPIPLEVDKSDIDVKFQALKVDISIPDREKMTLYCPHRLIPDGSFWTFEQDRDANKYLMLDLEKR
jgi:hypothetical protein